MHEHDPVSAISEAEATGRTAELFADIRNVMQIPLITSIWRTLDAVEGGLEAAWSAARPIYQSGQADALLARFRDELELAMPEPLSAHQIHSLGIKQADREAILSTIEAYNRSNGLNLIALTALVRPGTSKQLQATAAPPVQWSALPPLLSKAEIEADNWALLEKTIPLAAIHITKALPTLWRHLIHWPNLIEYILECYDSLHQAGTLFNMVDRTIEFVEWKAPALSHFRDTSIEIPPEALEMIDSYVGAPPSVSRMVSLGCSVANWLKSSPWTGA